MEVLFSKMEIESSIFIVLHLQMLLNNSLTFCNQRTDMVSASVLSSTKPYILLEHHIRTNEAGKHPWKYQMHQ